MWIAVVTGHMTLLDPYLIKPAMDAITDGWTLGCRARSLQFVRFEERLGDPLEAVQAEYGLLHDRRPVTTTPRERTPTLIAAAGGAG
jgi:ubiquinone biosynthesis protein Coq4